MGIENERERTSSMLDCKHNVLHKPILLKMEKEIINFPDSSLCEALGFWDKKPAIDGWIDLRITGYRSSHVVPRRPTSSHFGFLQWRDRQVA